MAIKKIKEIDLSMFGGMILYFLGHPGYEKWGNLTRQDKIILAQTFLKQDFNERVFTGQEIRYVFDLLEKLKGVSTK